MGKTVFAALLIHISSIVPQVGHESGPEWANSGVSGRGGICHWNDGEPAVVRAPVERGGRGAGIRPTPLRCFAGATRARRGGALTAALRLRAEAVASLAEGGNQGDLKSCGNRRMPLSAMRTHICVTRKRGLFSALRSRRRDREAVLEGASGNLPHAKISGFSPRALALEWRVRCRCGGCWVQRRRCRQSRLLPCLARPRFFIRSP